MSKQSHFEGSLLIEIQFPANTYIITTTASPSRVSIASFAGENPLVPACVRKTPFYSLKPARNVGCLST